MNRASCHHTHDSRKLEIGQNLHSENWTGSFKSFDNKYIYIDTFMQSFIDSESFIIFETGKVWGIIGKLFSN